MGIPMVEGRDFTDADAEGSTPVTAVDERLARQYWPSESAIGKRIRFGPPEDNEPWHTIVGVVGAVRHERLDRHTRQSIYVPHQQIPVRGMTLAIRAAGDPESLATAVRREVQALDKDQPVTSVMTMEAVISGSVWQQRFYTILFGVFALLALVLASVGIYGVMSYAVAQRTQEIGIRMALGARAVDVLKLIIRNGMALITAGVVIGLIGAVALTRLLTTLLFGVTPTDMATFAAVSAGLIVVALLACYLPARRATKVDPLVALRYE
jgi:putative ABC transport system permease protein